MTARMDTHALGDGFCRRAVSSGLVYYPPTTSRPRSHSTGSPVGNTTTTTTTSTLPPAKKTTVKIVMGKNYIKNGTSRAFEELKKQQSQSSSSSGNGSNTTNTGGTTTTSRYKTELCRPYQEYRVCKYGDKCQFAHGEHDLRVLPRHPKYKTELCRTYHSTGFCPYGPRCHFIHNLDEARNPSDTPPCSPIKKNAGPFSLTALPISPSVDSGISSPDGFSGGGGVSCRSFEFPAIGTGSQGSSTSSGMGSDEGGDDRFRGNSTIRTRYATYSPLNGDSSSDLEASESGIQVDYPGPEISELDLPSSSYDNSSPFKPVGGSGGGRGFNNVPSDPALNLQNLLSGLGIRDDAPLPRPLSPPPLFPVSLTLPPGPASTGSLGSARRLPVFDDMMNSKSDTALLVGFASDPCHPSTFPTFP